MDIVFGTITAFCVLVVMKSFMLPTTSSVKETKTEIIEEKVSPVALIEEPILPNEPTRHVYNIEFLRNIAKSIPDDHRETYSISVKTPDYHSRYSPAPYRISRGKSPDPYNYFRNHTPEPAEFVNRSPRSRLCPEEEKEYVQTMRELTPDYCNMEVSELPKDVQIGRVNWLKKNNGRIHVLQPIKGVRDIFFHIHDCEFEEGDSMKLGDSVMFELSLFENRLCAVKVKKMATKAIPSPDFSRRVMKHSQEELPQIEELLL